MIDKIFAVEKNHLAQCMRRPQIRMENKNRCDIIERQSVHRRMDRRMGRATHQHNKQCSNSIKIHSILFYLRRYTIKLLLTQITVHTGNICSDIQRAWASLRSVQTP